jgi:hypothetical protein
MILTMDVGYYRENDICYDEDRGIVMDAVDYDLEIAKREAQAREKMTMGLQPVPDPLVAAMGKMLVAALNREVGLEAAIVDLQRRIAELENAKN